MPSFDTIVIVLHVVTTFLGTVLGYGGRLSLALCFFLSAFANAGLASAALKGHRTLVIDIGLLLLGAWLVLIMRLYRRRRV